MISSASTAQREGACRRLGFKRGVRANANHTRCIMRSAVWCVCIVRGRHRSTRRGGVVYKLFIHHLTILIFVFVSVCLPHHSFMLTALRLEIASSTTIHWFAQVGLDDCAANETDDGGRQTLGGPHRPHIRRLLAALALGFYSVCAPNNNMCIFETLLIGVSCVVRCAVYTIV